MNPEIRMTNRGMKQIRNQLIMCTVFLLMFVPLLIKFTGVIPLLRRTPENMVFVAAATCLIAFLVIGSGWYWILFAIHVRSARFQNGGIDIERIFAPRVRILCGRVVTQKAIPAPSFNAPGYLRGTLFIAGTSSFYVPGNLPEAHLLIESLLRKARSDNG